MMFKLTHKLYMYMYHKINFYIVIIIIIVEGSIKCTYCVQEETKVKDTAVSSLVQQEISNNSISLFEIPDYANSKYRKRYST